MVGQWTKTSSRLLSSVDSEQNQAMGMEIGEYTCYSLDPEYTPQHELENTETKIVYPLEKI